MAAFDGVARSHKRVIVDERGTEEDKKETEEIIRILKVDFNQYEDKADTRNRECILAKLNKIIKEWI